MSQRTFKYFSIGTGGTPQPLVGTTLTAAVAPPINVPDPTVALTTLPVADSSMFLNGDWMMLDATGLAAEERVLVFRVLSSTSIQVKGMLSSHASGAWVRLATLMNSLYVQSLDGNSGALYVGTSSAMVKATGVWTIAKMVAVASGTQPVELDSTRSGLANPDDLGQLWIDGTTGDKYLPSIGQI
jgi:hypothetical protein